MKLLAAFTLLGFVANSSSTTQYTFDFTSQLLTGIPELNSQYAGLRITAKAVIQSFPDKTIRIQLQDAKYMTYNDVLDLTEDMDILSTEQVDVPAAIKIHLEASFKVFYDDKWVIKEMITESDEPEFITNLKKSFCKGYLGMVHTQDMMLNTNTIIRNQNQLKTTFKTMEQSVVGECEVQYTVNKLPEYLAVEFEQKEQNREAALLCQGMDYYEVLKIKNFDKCNKRPIYQQTYGASSKSDGSMGATSPYVTESSVERSIRCGSLDDNFIRKTTVAATYLTSPTGNFESAEKIVVMSKLTYVLKSIDTMPSEIKDVLNPKIYLSIKFEIPARHYWTGESQIALSKILETNMIQQLPQPDMNSALTSLYTIGSEKSKQVFVETFVKVLDVSKQSPESSHAGEDVTEEVVHLTKILTNTLSYSDIQDVWTMIKTNLHHDLAYKENAHHVFMDLLSIAATNPCIKYVSEMVKNEVITGEPATWILANLIKSVKTPTTEVIEELTDLLKHPSVQNVESLKATVAMSLTELVHKACIDETSSVFNYPTGVFGKFCDKDSNVIKSELLPYLVEKLCEQKSELLLQQPTTSAINSALIHINALGNLGIDEASHTLLQVVEGKITVHPHLRSVAVYKLIRSAKRNPSVYRNIIISIIHNLAENEEVRMAAISVLSYTQPSSSDFQKLAIRTWFETSQQVSSFITTTLKSLKQIQHMPMQLGAYQKIAKQAEAAYKLAKPVQTVIQTSHNIKIWQYLDTLKSAVSLNLQYVNSEESAIPRNIFVKSKINSQTQNIETFESAVYIQGTEVLIEKLYNMYKKTEQQDQPKVQKESILNIRNRGTKQPEAHVTLKMLGLQRLFSIDSHMIQDIIMQLTDEFNPDNQASVIKKDFLKIIDLAGFQNIIPTESGIPLYVQKMTPMVISIHASLVMIKSGEAEIKIKPVINYKQKMSVGIFCPFTKKFLSAGVDTSLHVSVPLKADIGLQNGQFSITLKTPTDFESQKIKPVFDLNVRPYTTRTSLPSVSSFQNEVKTINSLTEKKMMEVQLGEKLGLDLKLKMKSEHKFTDLANFLQELSHHQSLTVLSLPLPLKTVRSHSVSLIYNPKKSTTKDALFVFSVGYGQKSTESDQSIMIYPIFQANKNIENECQYEVDQMEPEEQEHKHQECLKRKLCSHKKQLCQAELKKQNRPSSEVSKYCLLKFSQCSQRHISRQHTRSVLSKLQSGSAVTINAVASLHGEHEDTTKKIETHITVGLKPGHHKAGEKSEIKLMASLNTYPNDNPFDIDIYATTKLNLPINKWDKEALLQQDLHAHVSVRADIGFRGEQKTSMSADIKAVQSEDQKIVAKYSSIAAKCESDVSIGQKLSESCKQTRTHAASLDVIEATLKVPVYISQNPHIQSLTELVKVFCWPYMSTSQVEYLQWKQKPGMDKYVMKAKIDQLGQKLSLNIKNAGQLTEIKDLRLGAYMQGLLPISTKENTLMNIVQKLTVHGAPSVCSIEGGKVTTFDKVKYDYQLNDCEHVIFKDCSSSNTIEVSVKKTAHIQYVKVLIDNNKYELELMKPYRSMRSAGTVKVNGDQKEIQHGHHGKQRDVSEFVEMEKNYYMDGNTFLTSYKDGVFAIISKLYGISIYADSESVEVRTFQHSLRNQVCGLCGDLNDEKTADIKSAESCIMSSPKLAAYSYMIADQTCQGIPAQDLKQFIAESSKCIKKTEVPTPVIAIFTQKTVVSKKHVIEEFINKVCISKEQVGICGMSSVPKEIIMKQASFFCVSKDTTGATLQRMAQHGEKIQDVELFPTQYTKEVSQPIKC